jgi:hypothetical protein
MIIIDAVSGHVSSDHPLRHTIGRGVTTDQPPFNDDDIARIMYESVANESSMGPRTKNLFQVSRCVGQRNSESV